MPLDASCREAASDAPNGGGIRLWGVWAGLGPDDRALVCLRGAALLGVLCWAAFAPVQSAVRWECLALLGAFLGYSVLTVRALTAWPGRARAVHAAELAADLIFLCFLFGATGGAASPLLPAAFVAAASAALRYGPAGGVAVAMGAPALALLWGAPRVSPGHWAQAPLLLVFITLTAAYIGWVSRREAGERRDIRRLRRGLQARTRELEEAYRRRREAQDHLVHSERLATIGRMSAEMAHQVRNPLSSISLNLELIEDELARPSGAARDEARDLMTAIHDEIDNLVAVTESYLRFAKLPPFRWEDACLNDLVRQILVLFGAQIEQRAITVSRRLGDDLPLARVDRRQFKFAVMNVLTNALEAMSAGGRLRVRTRLNGALELAVADTGGGIPPENLPKVFDPFFTTKRGGTGLGLSLARRIVEAHGGSVACRSIRGVGTTLTILLPIGGRTVAESKHAERNGCGS